MIWTIHIAASTHVGKVRKLNEDMLGISGWLSNHLELPPKIIHLDADGDLLTLIADGMGGHAAGEVASELAIQTLFAELAKSPARDVKSLEDALHVSNKTIFDAMRKPHGSMGMGSTVVGLSIHNETAFIFNVGDSRAYKLRDGYLVQLSVDDSADPPTYGEEAVHEKTGRITQALGGATRFVEIVPHISSIKLQPGLIILLCSDGLSDMVTLEQMESLMSSDIHESAARLQDAALAAGGADNISIMILRFEIFNLGAYSIAGESA
jgi:serine/threonine protein phosphatase PrpC